MKNRIVSIALLLCLLYLVSCGSASLTNTYADNNKIKEVLNIDELFSKTPTETSDAIIRVYYTTGASNEKFGIIYLEDNLKTGKVINIQGNKKEGYFKTIQLVKSPVQENYDFFPNGKLRGRSSSYIGYLKTDGQQTVRPSFSFATGRSYVVDEKGRVILERDTDADFTILFSDLEKIALEKEGININQDAFNVNKKTKLQVSDYLKFTNYVDDENINYWEIDYQKPAEDKKLIIVGATTGKIVYKGNITPQDH